VAARQAELEALRAALEALGVDRAALEAAWDLTAAALERVGRGLPALAPAGEALRAWQRIAAPSALYHLCPSLFDALGDEVERGLRAIGIDPHAPRSRRLTEGRT
jgi:hypothetical protein